MTSQPIVPAIPFFHDLEGNALEAGYIYIGEKDQNPQAYPVTVYWDKALTITATQPIRTVSGRPSRNGKPSKVYANSGYSILVNDRNGQQVYSDLSQILELTDVVITGGTIDGVTIGAITPGDGFFDNLTVTNLITNLSQSYRSRIINGSFRVWQRGTSQTSSGYGSDDRWENRNVGSTKTHSRQAFTVGQTDVPGNPTYFSRTVVSTVAGAANYVRKTQKIEDVQTFSGLNATLSFYAKADSSKNIAIEFIQYFGASGSATVTGIGAQQITLTSVWQKFEITVAIPSILGKTVDDLSYLGLNFFFDAGTDYDARTDTLGQQNGTFDIALVQLEEGDAASAFDLPTKRDELAQCMRRYVRFTGNVEQATIGSGVCANTTTARIAVFPPVPLARRPDVSYGGTLYAQDGGGGHSVSAIASDNSNEPFPSVLVNLTTSGLTTGEGAIAWVDTTSSDYFELDSEL